MIATVFAAATLAFGAGDIHLPDQTTGETPCVLLIHGGGWTGMCRRDVVGIADFLRRDLGCVVYNVDYRLATKATPWPACGEDCVAAAKQMFTDDFAKASGVRPRQIWIIGGSAGGHLALWTGLSLPAEQVAGIVSISGIADLGPDFACHPGRYRALFGGQEPTVARMRLANPIHLIRTNGPKVLCTHARGDKVVPIESARAFEQAYRAAGNEIDFHEYPTTCERGLTGHCIWIPGSKPHRLIPMLERRIACFMRPPEIPEPRPLRFGVMADVHVDRSHFSEAGGGHSVRILRQALRLLRNRSVDGVVVCGDLTQDGRIAELQRFAATWWEVFPDDRRPDGGRVERIFAFGDHDVERPFLLQKHWPEQLNDPKVVDDLRKTHIAFVDRAKVWKDVFREDFAPIGRRTVKGYDFVVAHLVNKDEDGLRYADPLHIPGLEAFFATNAFDRTKPFFYVQHKLPRGTVGGPHQTGQDAGRTTAVLARYPNAVGFCGHKHRSATEELSLWQGAFTQVQSPALATLLTAAGRENSRCSCEAPCSTPPQQMEAIDSRADGAQVLVVTVHSDRLEIERLDVLHGGEAVAAPWTVRLPNDGSAAYAARGARAPVPRFAAGTKVSVCRRLGKDRAGTVMKQVVVSFRRHGRRGPTIMK